MSILQLEGAYENELAATGDFNPHAPKTALMLPSGQRVVLPTELLLQAIGSVPSETAVAETNPAAAGVASEASVASQARVDARGGVATSAGASRDVEGEQVIPLVEEEMVVGKAEVETARVRLRRETEERIQTVTVPLTDVRWEVEHIPVEQLVEVAPEPRQVGETMIFPLVEERMMVRRELWLREEVHVRKVRTTVEKSAEFPVKRDVLVEDRS